MTLENDWQENKQENKCYHLNEAKSPQNEHESTKIAI